VDIVQSDGDDSNCCTPGTPLRLKIRSCLFLALALGMIRSNTGAESVDDEMLSPVRSGASTLLSGTGIPLSVSSIFKAPISVYRIFVSYRIRASLARSWTFSASSDLV
jgi:hypothetical protein